MIKNVLFIGDHYRGDQDKNIKILFGLLSPIFLDIHINANIISNTQKCANEKKWIASLSLQGESILKNYDLTNTAIIGFEINPIDIQFLNSINIPWINIEIHPIRFLEDLYFSVYSSLDFNFNTMAIQNTYIKFTANTLKLNSLNLNNKIKEDSLLIIGQTPKDKSIFFDKKFKSLLDYTEALDNLCKKHKNIYYRPHPNLSNNEVDKEIIKRYNATLLTAENYYDIISNENIKTVCGISSSSLYEGEYFDKKIIFLEKRVKNFSKPISLQTLLNSSKLWHKNFLSMNKYNDILLEFKVPRNTCRNLYGAWAYETPIAKLNHTLHTLENKVSHTDAKISTTEIKANQAEAKANQAEAKANQAEAKANQAEAKANQAEAKANQAEAKANQAEAKANETLHHYHMIQNSTSWKITKPYRYAGDKSKWFYTNAKNWVTFSYGSRPRRVSKKILLNIKYYLNSHPKLKYKIVKILNKFPILQERLRKVGKTSPSPMQISTNDHIEISALSPQVKKIYDDLKKAIEQQGNK